MSNRLECCISSSPSFADIIDLIQSDARFPTHRRDGVLSSLRKTTDWIGQVDSHLVPRAASVTPFAMRSINALFGKLAPGAVGVSRKRLQNARSDCKFVLSFYDLESRTKRCALSQTWQSLQNTVTDRFRRMQLSRFFQYLSRNAIDPGDVTDNNAEEFLIALRHDGSIRRSDVIWRQAVHAWNREARGNSHWPNVQLSVPIFRRTWGRRWSTFPPSLERAVDSFFCHDPNSEDLFDVGRVPLAATTIEAQKQCLRLAASALVQSGVDPLTITGLRELCTPAAFRSAVKKIADMRGGVVSTAENIAHVIRKVAKLSGTLSPEEVKDVQEAYRNLRRHFKHRAFPRKDRDQAVLERMDDPTLVDAFLSLGRRTVAAVRKSRKRTRRVALDVQLALALELSICAPVRMKNLVSLNLDKHFFKMNLDGAELTVLRIAGVETKNGEPAEHILNADTTDLLHLYAKVYRPLTAKDPGPWVFPGTQGRHKSGNVLARQITLWVREELGIDYHPHLIRKIMPKIYLDVDPGGLEVVRRQLGHTSNRMLHQVYLQRRHRASQRKYVDALEARRLRAFGLAEIGNKQGQGDANG